MTLLYEHHLHARDGVTDELDRQDGQEDPEDVASEVHDDDADQHHGQVVLRLPVLLSVGGIGSVGSVGGCVDGHDGGVVGGRSALVPHGVGLPDTCGPIIAIKKCLGLGSILVPEFSRHTEWTNSFNQHCLREPYDHAIREQ